MSKSRWIVAVTLGLALSILGSEQASSQNQETSNHEQSTQSSIDDAEPFSVPVRVIEDVEQAQARQAAEQHSRDLNERDLIAQEGMNRATESIKDATWLMLFASAVSTIFVAIGTGILIWTLRLTQDATNEARITNQIILSEQRPWLSCEIDLFGFDDPKGIKTVCDFTIHNYGKRPGFDAIVMVRPVQYYVWQDVRDVIKDVKDGLNLDRRADFPVVYPGVPLSKPQTHTQIGGMLGYRGSQVALISVLAYRVARESESRDGMEIRAYDVLRKSDTPDGHSGRIEEHEDGFVL